MLQCMFRCLVVFVTALPSTKRALDVGLYRASLSLGLHHPVKSFLHPARFQRGAHMPFLTPGHCGCRKMGHHPVQRKAWSYCTFRLKAIGGNGRVTSRAARPVGMAEGSATR